MTPCSSMACHDHATHYSRRFGPEAPYCYRDACWSDGIDPIKATPMTRPPVWPEETHNRG